jgi:hypothetical protein
MAISLDFGRIFYGKPAPTPHQVRGLLFRKMLLPNFRRFPRAPDPADRFAFVLRSALDSAPSPPVQAEWDNGRSCRFSTER